MNAAAAWRRLRPTPTRRGLLLLLLALVPLALGIRFPGLALPGLLLAAAAWAAVLADGAAAPDGRTLRAVREIEPVVGVGLAADAAATVRGLPSGTRVTLRDETPLPLCAEGAVGAGVATAEGWARLAYTVHPVVRGHHPLGSVVVRTEGPLRLATAQTSLLPDGPRAVDVDPDLSAVRAWESLGRRGRLQDLGIRSVRTRADGTDFDRIREAVPDDPLRSVNWRATARTGRVMVSELVPERSQPVMLCVDHGRLMGVGAGALTKLDHALAAVLLLAHVALHTGDRVGLVAVGGEVDAVVPVRAGRPHLGALLRATRALQPVAVEADLDALGDHLARTQKRRALVIVVTDIVDADQARTLEALSRRLRRRHLVLVVTVRDPAVDDVRLRAPATYGDVLERVVALDMHDDRATALRGLRLAGVDTLDADPRTLGPGVVNRYLEVKRRGRL